MVKSCISTENSLCFFVSFAKPKFTAIFSCLFFDKRPLYTWPVKMHLNKKYQILGLDLIIYTFLFSGISESLGLFYVCVWCEISVQVLFFSLCMWLSNCSSTICWKDLFPHWIVLAPLLKISWSCMCRSIFGLSICSIDLYVCVNANTTLSWLP